MIMITKMLKALKHKRNKTLPNPYEGITFLKPIQCRTISDIFEKDNFSVAFSVVISIKNEENSIEEFIDSIVDQTLLPDEVIFIDHFSTDATVAKIIKKRQNCPFKIVLLSAKNSPQFETTQRSTLAGNRNYGVKIAKNEFILFTDCGNLLNKNFFKSLIMPLHKNKNVDLVGGIYKTQSTDLDKIMTFNWEDLDWNTFLPACRGQAIKKSIYLKCGGQPEWVTYAGEDAYYDFQYRKFSNVWLFNTAACITWIAPQNTEEIRNKFYAYGVGDGETGLGNPMFNAFIATHFRSDIPIDVCNEAKFFGFCEGRNRRSQIDKIRNLKGIELLFVKEQMIFHESTENIVMDSVKNGWRVICIVCEPRKIRGLKKYIDIDFSKVELYNADNFNIEDVISRFPSECIKGSVRCSYDRFNVSPRTLEIYTESVKIIER